METTEGTAAVATAKLGDLSTVSILVVELLSKWSDGLIRPVVTSLRSASDTAPTTNRLRCFNGASNEPFAVRGDVNEAPLLPPPSETSMVSPASQTLATTFGDTLTLELLIGDRARPVDGRNTEAVATLTDMLVGIVGAAAE